MQYQINKLKLNTITPISGNKEFLEKIESYKYEDEPVIVYRLNSYFNAAGSKFISIESGKTYLQLWFGDLGYFIELSLISYDKKEWTSINNVDLSFAEKGVPSFDFSTIPKNEKYINLSVANILVQLNSNAIFFWFDKVSLEELFWVNLDKFYFAINLDKELVGVAIKDIV